MPGEGEEKVSGNEATSSSPGKEGLNEARTRCKNPEGRGAGRENLNP